MREAHSKIGFIYQKKKIFVHLIVLVKWWFGENAWKNYSDTKNSRPEDISLIHLSIYLGTAENQLGHNIYLRKLTELCNLQLLLTPRISPENISLFKVTI